MYRKVSRKNNPRKKRRGNDPTNAVPGGAGIAVNAPFRGWNAIEYCARIMAGEVPVGIWTLSLTKRVAFPMN